LINFRFIWNTNNFFTIYYVEENDSIMKITQVTIKSMIQSEIENQIMLENMRSKITREDKLLVSLLSESKSLEEFSDKVYLLNESIGQTILGLLGIGYQQQVGGAQKSMEGILNGLKRWFFGKLVGLLGVKNPHTRDAIASLITELEFRELLAIWKGEASACQEIAEAMAQSAVYLAAAGLPSQLGMDHATQWGKAMVDQFAEAVKSSAVIETLAAELQVTVCKTISELFPKGSRLGKFFAAPETAAAGGAAAAAGGAAAAAGVAATEKPKKRDTSGLGHRELWPGEKKGEEAPKPKPKAKKEKTASKKKKEEKKN